MSCHKDSQSSFPDCQHSACSESRRGNTDLKQIQDIGAKFRCEVAINGKVKKNRNFTFQRFFGVEVGCYPNSRENRQQNIVWQIHEDRFSQTLVACWRSSKTVQWPGKFDFSPFSIARQICPELDTKLQLDSFLYWAILYKNVENGPDGIVTEVAKWRQIKHFGQNRQPWDDVGVPKMHGVKAHSRHTTSKQIVWNSIIIYWHLLAIKVTWLDFVYSHDKSVKKRVSGFSP